MLVAGMARINYANAQSGTTGSLTWNLNGRTLTISGIGTMPNYDGADMPWYSNRTLINTVVIEEDVTNNIYLTYVTISSKVTTIGNYTFKGCNTLITITIPNNITSVGYGAFSGCSSLEKVNYNAINCTRMGSCVNRLGEIIKTNNRHKTIA